MTTHDFYVCDRCTVSIHNDDWTWADEYVETPEESLEECARLTANVEAMGLVTHQRTQDLGGYWDCWVCGSSEIGTANVWSDD